jgi:type I restriction enzyme, S subunit
MTTASQDRAIPQGWKPYQFSDVLIDGAISYGIVQPGAHCEGNSVPIVRVNNIRNGQIETRDVLKVASEVEAQYSRTRLKGGELLITVVGTVGDCAIVPNALAGWNVARAVSVARIRPEFDVRFIKYCFKLEDVVFQMYGNTNDTVQPTLNLGQLKNLVLTAPGFDEQFAIAEVLASLDSKIDLLNAQNQTLETMVATQFRQMFLEVAADHWVDYSVSDFADHIKQGIQPGDHPLTSFLHYSLPAFDAGQRPAVELGSQILSNKFKVSEGVLLASKLNPRVSRIWPIEKLPEGANAICSTEFQVLKPKNPVWFGYLYGLLTSDDARDALTMAASGTSGSHQRVRPEDILAIKTSLPSLELAEQFSSWVEPILAKRQRNIEQVVALEQLRDSLLPKLMSGEVRVAY